VVLSLAKQRFTQVRYVRTARKGSAGKAALNSYIAPPVQRAVRLLRYIADGNPVTSMGETAKALKINRTTLLRLLHTLEVEGIIERRPRQGGYQVRLSLVILASRIVFSQDLLRVAFPIVARLAEAVDDVSTPWRS
jgi:DNA-binding IclR family transcriptional regulator